MTSVWWRASLACASWPWWRAKSTRSKGQEWCWHNRLNSTGTACRCQSNPHLWCGLQRVSYGEATVRESCRGVPSYGAVKCKPDLPVAETRRRSRRTVVCCGVAVQKGSELEVNSLSGVRNKVWKKRKAIDMADTVKKFKKGISARTTEILRKAVWLFVSNSLIYCSVSFQLLELLILWTVVTHKHC
jgi:hypothetical protein